MARLGYERFGAQGGDWGSAVTTTIGALHPDRVLGIHVNMPTVPLGPLPDDATDSERTNFDDFQWHTPGAPAPDRTVHPAADVGLRPRRLAGGQLAWIVEKSGRGPTATATRSPSSRATNSSTT